METPVQVKDIDPAELEPPYSIALARAVTGGYMQNGSRYLGAHFLHPRFKNAQFLLTGIVDETSPDHFDERAKLMVQGGTQLGCSTRECNFCIYSQLPFYGNLSVQETVDIFRAALFLHAKVSDVHSDERRLDLKFTDNGEPLENKNLTLSLDELLRRFGKERKILGFKVSSIFRELPSVRSNFEQLCDWQKDNREGASIHLQISKPLSGERVMSASAIARIIERWSEVNPRDTMCITPGIVKGSDQQGLLRFLSELESLRRHFFVRIAVIKPSTPDQEDQIIPRAELQAVHDQIASLGIDVRALQSDDTYQSQLRGAGTLSHLPNGNIFDPRRYQPWEYEEGLLEPNTPH